MSMNDVNMAPANQGKPIKGQGEGVDAQALGGGKIAGSEFLFRTLCSPRAGGRRSANVWAIYIDAPSIGSGTGSSGERREEELRAKVPGLEEKEKIEQGKT